MRNYLFYPLAHDDIDNVSPLNINTSTTTSTQTSPINKIQSENKISSLSMIYNIPFFNTLFYPSIFSTKKTHSIGTQKILFYYQTFSSLDTIINLKCKTNADIYVYISSVHFGLENKTPYIGINNNPVNQQGTLWDDALKANENGINIMLMLGGAGGAYTTMFSNFEVYYDLLYKLLNEKRYIKGIDLDIEEGVKLEDVKMLIKRLNKDFGNDFIITLAPVASSMMYDMPGMGDFVYKELHTSSEGELISWYNVQCYEECSFNVYNTIIENGYTPDKIVFGILGDDYDSSSFIPIKEEINKIKIKYPTMGGCILWEYGDTGINPVEWAIDI